MKTNFRFFSWLCTTFVALLGFAACDDDKPEEIDIPVAYGTPTADYKYMGTVTDEDGNPIKGINIVFQSNSNSLNKELYRTITNENGQYSTDYIHWSAGSGIYQATFTDVDGDENGGHFEDAVIKTHKMNKEQTEKGDGWYQGKFELTTEVKLEAKPSEDNTETDNTENNESNE